MLSGIGPKDHLKNYHIPLIHDLSGVGQNLQDHLTVNVSYKVNVLKTFSELMQPFMMIKNLCEYFLKDTGLMTYPASDIGVFFKTNSNEKTPNAQIHFAPGAGEYKKNGAMRPSSGITASICNLRPVSRGHIELQSSDPDVAPKIYANYLDDEKDIKHMIEGVNKIREVFNTPTMKNLGATEIQPGSIYQTDDEIDSFIRSESLSVYHPVGTCKMGKDNLAVVSDRLKVRGVDALRVVDASIMPRITSGNTNAPTVMIAEQGSRFILSDNS